MNELEKIESELKEWIFFQNGIIGVLGFSFSLACLSLDYPVSFIASIASIFMLVALGQVNSPRFSSSLLLLRSKGILDEKEQEILDYATRNFLSNFRYLAFNIGFFSLIITLVYTGWDYLCPMTVRAFNMVF